MFDKYMVVSRGFQNVRKDGQIVGFQIKVRITYYRGVYLPLIGGFDVTVDGEKFRPEQIQFVIGDHAYSFEQMANAEEARWPFGEFATLIISKPGGLRPGLHEIEVIQTIKPSYAGPNGFRGYWKKKIALVA